VVTGAHYLSDVIAGAAIGMVITRLLAYWLLSQRTAAKPERDAASHYSAV
jgi:membrane-associated phospholipid phosphatase